MAPLEGLRVIELARILAGPWAGQILADRATAVTVAPFKGPNYFSVNDAMQQAISRVDVDETDDMASSWAKFEEAVNALG